MRSINPGYKMLTLIIASLILSTTFNVKVNFLVCFVALLLTFTTSKVDKKKLLLTMIPFLVSAFGMFMAGLIYGRHSNISSGVEITAFGQRTLYASDITTALQLASRILAYGSLGILFAFTSNSFEFIMSLMQQFHLPPMFAYGILASYHFFPVVKEEYKIVGEAMRVRGAKVGVFSRKRLIPMIVQSIERSADLAMAMESRGFQGDAKRSVAFKVELRKRDFAFLITVNFLIILALVFIR